MKNRINWTATILIALGSLLILFPLYMAVVVALKNPVEMARSILSPPIHWHLENFTRAIAMTDFFQALANSAMITVIAVTFTLLTNSMVAYAIARNLNRRFFKFLYYYFISAMFIPFPLIMLPIVKETSALEMNHPLGLSLLYIVYGLSLNIFIYVGYIRSIPRELEEAAIMDGASTWSVFWKVIFPLLAPINATVGILTCLWTWNDFMLPLIVLNEPEMATLPLKQYIFQGQFSTDYNTAFASYLLALSPLVLIYLFAQRWIINGVTKGALK
ncbi:carbohydrate ABC transporter permease [Polycladomyces subterraneus]|uniref:Carbohydrate ABC transporter permease n=1 Tax=Polycladomyces subterraneus TaxID=1016997 RepID=A0ABT8IP16_9BACL|nr:carbohydrate ABC transporter permease [Polycladomyces subterraneus]MDN4594532.1 carbohydrate ABC transporter permease [Polycladomyces subterraneus]